ncbi:MAG: extracellular solute-binding protein [Parcubacteria group bacterium]|jgi:multiple sugar transport system substrate-binding protein
MEKKSINKFHIAGVFLVIIALIFLSGCGLKPTPEKRYPIKLEIWGLFDDSDTFLGTFEAYQKSNPNVLSISYKKLSPDTYKKELVEALASGQGPDIFLIQNTWLPSFMDKITPVTADILTEQKFRSDFVDVVAADFIDQGKIYAVPLSVDTLGLYYNKDLFNQAGITSPPATWDDFAEDVKKLTKIDGIGRIQQAGAAIGTAYNINRSTDVLTLLMLQNGTKMTDDRQSRALFDQGGGKRDSNGKSVIPGLETLNFYTQFAKAGTFYTWNKEMHYSTDAFSENNLAMMLNYSWQIPTIRNKAPKLNFAVAPIPQLNPSTPINFPNYWGFAVAKNKAESSVTSGSQKVQVPDAVRVAEAWNFLKFLAAKPGATEVSAFDAAADYAQKTNKPAARRDLIEKQKTDTDIGVFAQGNLIAKDWREVDPIAIESIFASMIDSVNSGSATSMDALKSASAQVTQLMNNR